MRNHQRREKMVGGGGGGGGHCWKKGTKVEVTSHEEGFTGAWYEATIVRPPWKSPICKKTNKALVQYQTLVTDDDDTEIDNNGGSKSNSKPLLQEYFHESFMRPIPPSSETRRESFELNDVVDAFCQDGWWTGVVTQVLPGSNRYTVTFQNPPDQLDLDVSSLRLHLDWINGQWVRPQKLEVIAAAEHPEQLGHSCNTANNPTEAIQLESSGSGTAKDKTEERTINPTNSGKNQTEQTTPCNQILSCARISTKKKLKEATPGSDATTSRSSKRLKKGDKTEYNGGEKIEVIAAAEHPEQLGHSCNTTNNPTKAIQLESSGSDNAKDKTEERTISPTNSGKNQTEQTTPCNQIVFAGISTNKKLKLATPGSDATTSRPSKRPKKGDKTEFNEGEKIETVQQEIKLGNQTEDIIKRKGRPPNLHVKSSPTLVAGMEIKAGVDHEQNVGKESVMKEAKKSAILGIKSMKKNKSQLINACPLLSEEISQGKECGTTSQTESRGRPPKLLIENQKSSVMIGKVCTSEEVKSSTTTYVNMTGSQDASIGKVAGVSETDCGREKPKMATTKISFDVTGDHQPLRMCSEGIYSSTQLDDSNGTVNQWNEARESKLELALIDCNDNSVLRLNQKLPFVKSSRIWEMVDSMEVFQTMQQNPHFHPLYNFKEEFREGLAIGTVVTFANLVERTGKLQLDDPRSIWVSYLEVLLDLETHGFDVQVLKDRLNELLALKDRQEQNLHELNQCEIRLLEEMNNNSKIDEEIVMLNEKIKELKEKRASALSIKKIQDSEIATLQQKADDSREGIQSTQLDFERVNAVPLLTGM